DLVVGPGHVADREQAVVAGDVVAHALRGDRPAAVDDVDDVGRARGARPLDPGGQRPGRARVVDQRHRALRLVAGPVGGRDDDLVLAGHEVAPVDLDVEVARLQQAGVVVADGERLLGAAVQRPGQRGDVTVRVGDPPEHVGPLLGVAGGPDVLHVAVPDVDGR